MKQKRNLLKTSNAVTLISLIITIIVMLILAGVSISAVVGDNGVLKQAQTAKLAQEDAAWYENAQMVLASASMAKDNIEALTDEQKATPDLTESMEISFRKENMMKYLKEKFTSFDNSLPVLVGQNGEGYIIAQGERMVITKENLEIEGSSIHNKYKVAQAGDWLFEITTEGKARLTVYNLEKVGVIEIPAVVVDKDTGELYTVAELGDDLFNHGARITKIDFSRVTGSLEKIGARTFAFCEKMEITVPNDLPSGITSIGDKAFYGCENLKGNINAMMSSGITLGKGVFMKCTQITGDIQTVFEQNFYLEAGIPIATTIEEGQFSGYSGLTGTLTIPNYITSIGNNAFYGCLSMNNIVFAEGSTCVSIGDYAFSNCTSLSSNITLPNTVTTIGNYAFSESGITGITLPNTLSNLGSYAFYMCSNLTGEVIIPKTITTLAEYSFYETKLTKVTFDSTSTDGCEVIGEYAFYNSDNLTSVTFSQVLEKINQYAFYGCGVLGNISFPNSLTVVGNGAFHHASNLIVDSWSNKLTQISHAAFAYCYKITKLPDTDALKTIDSWGFLECTNIGSPTTDIIEWLQNSKITSVGEKAFYNCSQLTGTRPDVIKNSATPQVTISVNQTAFMRTGVTYAKTFKITGTTIPASAFAGATKIVNEAGTEITEIVIPNTVTSIGESAFKSCVTIKKITVPNSVTSIGGGAFQDCRELEEVYFEDGSTLETIPYRMVCYDSNLKKINLPDTVKYIGVAAFESCSKLEALDLPDSLIEITGSFTFSGVRLEELIIPDGVTTIGGLNTFNMPKLKNIVIPDSVTKIGTQAFNGCASLETITIGTGLKTIPEGCFNNLQSLKKVICKSDINKIDKQAFMNCPNLTELKDLNWMEISSIGYRAFYNCTGLSGEYQIKGGCEIDETAFDNCGIVLYQ